MKSRIIPVNKSELQVLAAIREYESLKKRTKHHDNAIEKLKGKGIIYKDKDCLLQINKQFEKKWFTNGQQLLTVLTISNFSSWKTRPTI